MPVFHIPTMPYMKKRERVFLKSVTGEDAQLCFMHLEPGEVTDHDHPHEQLGYILSGQVELLVPEVGLELVRMVVDQIRGSPGEPHGVVPHGVGRRTPRSADPGPCRRPRPARFRRARDRETRPGRRRSPGLGRAALDSRHAGPDRGPGLVRVSDAGDERDGLVDHFAQPEAAPVPFHHRELGLVKAPGPAIAK